MPAARIRRIVSGMLALALILVAGYAAAALLSPIPRLAVEQTLMVADDETLSAELRLPEAGSTAVAAGSGAAVTAGPTEPRPIAGAAKLVLVNVVLATEPLALGSPGPAMTIDQSAVDRLRALQARGARTVAVTFGQTWTRRDLLQATLLGSGNNTAELLVDEVFGGLDGYLEAATAWLAERGLNQTSVVDGTGLDPDSRSTAADLARLTQLSLAEPVLADLLERRPRETTAGTTVADEASFLRDAGTIGLVRSYTDAAGVCVLFVVPVGEERIAVAMLGQPGYPAAETAARELVASIRTAVRPVQLVAAGEVVAVATSDWGQSTELIATESVTVSSSELAEVSVRIEAAARSTIVRGADAGRLVVTVGDQQRIVRLESTGTISEPGAAWRFADPFTVIGRWTG